MQAKKGEATAGFDVGYRVLENNMTSESEFPTPRPSTFFISSEKTMSNFHAVVPIPPKENRNLGLNTDRESTILDALGKQGQLSLKTYKPHRECQGPHHLG